MILGQTVAQETQGGGLPGRQTAGLGGKFRISTNSAFRKPIVRDDQ